MNTFKEQAERPLDWYKSRADEQELLDHPEGLQSKKKEKKG